MADKNKPETIKPNIPVYMPDNDDVAETDIDSLVMNPTWQPLDRETYRQYSHIRNSDERMRGEGRLLPKQENLTKAMSRFLSMSPKERAERQDEWKGLVEAWDQHVAVDPPRADYGDAGSRAGASMPSNASEQDANERYWSQQPPKQVNAEQQRAYSRSQNKTYIFANGELLRTEDGDTRG